MLNNVLITIGKTISRTSQLLNRGNGSTWPGHIALKYNKNFIRELLTDSKIKTVLVAGTNGKTTTAKIITSVLEDNGYNVIQNESGANLLNGIASTLALHTNIQGKLTQDFAVFEVDENALPLVLKELKPDYIVFLNLFRDQLDRYGEINTIVSKWKKSIKALPAGTKLIANADDPQIAYLGHDRKNTVYYGLQSTDTTTKESEAADSIYCPKCGHKLKFSKFFFSHLGIWHCPSCKLTRPKPEIDTAPFYPLSGEYNRSNTHAAFLVLRELGLSLDKIEDSLKHFEPAFGRQEIIEYKKKKAQIFLSKNPTSFNQSYATMNEQQAKILLIVLNDRIPDGRDVSWIWDTEMPDIQHFDHILLAGDRVYDIALRIKYAGFTNYETFEDLEEAINKGIELLTTDETLFILPTYSAMLEVRKILTGKKIL